MNFSLENNTYSQLKLFFSSLEDTYIGTQVLECLTTMLCGTTTIYSSYFLFIVYYLVNYWAIMVSHLRQERGHF